MWVTTKMETARIFREVRVPTTDHRTVDWAGDKETTPISETPGDFEEVLSEEKVLDADEMNAWEIHEKMFVNELREKIMSMGKVEAFDQETIRDVERMVIIRVSTKHINLWMRQLDMKRKEMCELAMLLEFVEVKKEIEAEKFLESWSKRVSNHFTRKTENVVRRNRQHRVEWEREWDC